MDVAKRLAAWREQPPEQWLTAINRYLPPGVTAVLVIAIAYQLATITWTLTPGDGRRQCHTTVIGSRHACPLAPVR